MVEDKDRLIKSCSLDVFNADASQLCVPGRPQASDDTHQQMKCAYCEDYQRALF